MELALDKLAPRAIALAVVGYCVWPSLAAFQAQPETKPPEKPPEVAAALLKPAVAPFPKRDPFVMTNSRPEKKSSLAASGKNAALLVDPLSHLTLEATCLMGGKRLAMINGHLYACREKSPEGDASTPPFTLVSVLPYKVLLECGGKSLELMYSNVASSNAASRPALSAGAHAPAKGGGAGKPKSGGKSNKGKM